MFRCDPFAHKLAKLGIGLHAAASVSEAVGAYANAVSQINARYGDNPPEDIVEMLEHWKVDLERKFGPPIRPLIDGATGSTVKGSVMLPRRH